MMMARSSTSRRRVREPLLLSRVPSGAQSHLQADSRKDSTVTPSQAVLGQFITLGFGDTRGTLGPGGQRTAPRIPESVGCETSGVWLVPPCLLRLAPLVLYGRWLQI